MTSFDLIWLLIQKLLEENLTMTQMKIINLVKKTELNLVFGVV